MLAHLGGVLGLLPALVVYLVFKDRGPFVRHQSQEALNFQITVVVGYVGSVVLAFLPLIGMATIPLVWLSNVVLSIIAAVAANRGEWYRYPVSLRLVT